MASIEWIPSGAFQQTTGRRQGEQLQGRRVAENTQTSQVAVADEGGPVERSQDLTQFAPYQRLLPGSNQKPKPAFRPPVSVQGRWLWGILWVALIGATSTPLPAQQVPVRELQDPRLQDPRLQESTGPKVQPPTPPALDAALEAAKKKTIH
jgi:hypothetical protein